MTFIFISLFLFIGMISAAQPLPPRADDGSHIDVMVLYTQNARAIAGGSDAQTISAIAAAISGVNQAFTASGVLAQLHVVAYQPVFYLEQVNAGFHTDLNNLTGASDGYLDDIHALRDYYAADLVLLVTGTWFYIYTGDSALGAVPDAAEGFVVWEAKGLDDEGGIHPARWMARLFGVDDTPPFDLGQVAAINANRIAVANYRDSASRLIVPAILTQNGGFEIDMDDDHVPDFWNAKGWLAGDKRLCTKPLKARSGACSLKLGLDAGAKTLMQPVETSAIMLLDELSLTGYMLSAQGGNCIKAILTVSFTTLPAAKSVTTTCAAAPDLWTPFALQTVPADKVAAVKLKLKASGTGTVWLDDVYLEAVPLAAQGGW